MKYIKIMFPIILVVCFLFLVTVDTAAKESTVLHGSFTVSKRIKESALLKQDEPIYRFRLEQLDDNGFVKRYWIKSIYVDQDRLYPVDQDGYALLKTKFEGLAKGNYRVVELGAKQYDFSKGGSLSSNAIADGRAVRFTIDKDTVRNGSATFMNKNTISHESVKINL